MSFTDDLGPYVESDGLILERPRTSFGPETGNGIFNLSLLNIIKFRIGQLTKKDVQDYVQIIKTCEIEPGLFDRGPMKKEEFEGDDDYILLVSCSYLIGAPFAKDVLAYGRKHCWAFNDLNPGEWTLRACFGRKPGFISHVALCGGESTSFMGQWMLGATILLNNFSSDADSILKEWAIVQSLKGRGIVDNAISNWEYNIKKKGGMPKFANQYYGPAHPITKYIPEV